MTLYLVTTRYGVPVRLIHPFQSRQQAAKAREAIEKAWNWDGLKIVARAA